MRATALLVAASISGVLAPVALAAPIVSASHPSSYGTLVDDLTFAESSYAWPETPNYGHVWRLFPGGPIQDQTQLTSSVYRVSSPITVGTGPNQVSLNTGDMVFAYSIRLVATVPGTTISSLTSFEVNGIPAFGAGPDMMWAPAVKGMGYVTGATHSPNNTAFSDLWTGFEPFQMGGSGDWDWAAGDDGNLDNLESITLLMFTQPTQIGIGVASLFAPPGQASGINITLQGQGVAPPVLIPIIPAPASIGLLALGGVAAIRRRR